MTNNRARIFADNVSSRWEIKCWGKTREVVSSQFYSKHELEIVEGGYCSLHYHMERANRFVLQHGRVEIIEMYGPIVKRCMLGPDNIYDVPSLVPHMFIVYENGKMIEEYFADRGGKVSTNDIYRIEVGGRADISELESLPLSLNIFNDTIRKTPSTNC